MPFHLPFNFPYFYNDYNKYHSDNQNSFLNEKKQQSNFGPLTNDSNFIPKKEDSNNLESSESFFEIFGIKLYFDDLLIICILFFLYTEKIKNEELFICLILLLIT